MIDEVKQYRCRYCNVLVPEGTPRSKHELHCKYNGKGKIPMFPAGARSTHPCHRQIVTININRDMDDRIYVYVPLLFTSRSELVRAALLEQILHAEPLLEVPVKNPTTITVELPLLTLATTKTTGNSSAYTRGVLVRFLDRLDKLLEERGLV